MTHCMPLLMLHLMHRYYQNGLELLHQAVQDWQENDVSFVLQMGDILDGSQPREGSLEVLKSVSVVAGDCNGFECASLCVQQRAFRRVSENNPE